ncbi:MAG: hypothetical protein IJF18_01980 [Oscillospiraceae bacterium]|nr:hypothetical protein [Oscillospiraceae bacterium]
MYYGLKRFAEVSKALFPSYLLLICTDAIVLWYYYELDIRYVISIAVLVTLIYITAAVSVAVNDSGNRKNTADENIIGGSFRGFSKKSICFRDAVDELRSGEFNEALEDFKDIDDEELSDREKALICFYLGECYRFMGYSTNAGINYEKAIDGGLEDEFVYVLAARAFTTAGSYNHAMEFYGRLVEKGCMFEYLYTDMGMCCLKKQAPDEALEYFEKSVSMGKNYSFALGGKAIAYIMKKDVEKSREFYVKALLSNIVDIKGFLAYYRDVAEASGCTEEINEFVKLSFESEHKKEEE